MWQPNLFDILDTGLITRRYASRNKLETILEFLLKVRQAIRWLVITIATPFEWWNSFYWRNFKYWLTQLSLGAILINKFLLWLAKTNHVTIDIQ